MKPLNEEQMQDLYGDFYNANTKVPFARKDVPESLWPLIPYAQFWGVSDDWQREQLIQKAPIAVIKNLKVVTASFDDQLDEWLAGNESLSHSPSDAYIAFSAMRMGADFAT